jgi:CDGSH iron-sulfur domain-containing protein 3
MSEPFIAGRRSIKVNLQPGSYFWCACGRSASQPFCDGSHAGTDFQSVPFTVAAPGIVSLCACKHTHSPPYCDHTHRTLPPPDPAPPATGP